MKVQLRKDMQGHTVVRNLLSKGKKMLTLALPLCFALSMIFTQVAFATTPTTTDYSGITSALTGSLSAAQIVALIAAALGIGLGLMILWWGARKLVKVAVTAFKTGKIKF